MCISCSRPHTNIELRDEWVKGQGTAREGSGEETVIIPQAGWKRDEGRVEGGEVREVLSEISLSIKNSSVSLYAMHLRT